MSSRLRFDGWQFAIGKRNKVERPGKGRVVCGVGGLPMDL